jgi:two-component system phosphate regulon response regulator PhoB
MTQRSILIVEDEADILNLLQYNLEKDGFRVIPAESGEKGLQLARSESPDLILLDLMLPGIDGLEMCRILKADRKTSSIPIVMLTAKGEETDIVAGLELGADDYITKPFSPKVLIARMRAVMRRRSSRPVSGTEPIRLHEIAIHPGKRSVTVDGKHVDFTPTEFEIIYFLATHPGWVFTRYQIVDAIRDEISVVTDRSVDVQIVGIRKKLGDLGEVIETVRGVGYRMREEE